jgi:hypothetical protein
MAPPPIAPARITYDNPYSRIATVTEQASMTWR